MVDTTEALEGDYLTADVVKNAKSKIATVISEGSYVDVEFEAGKKSRRLSITIEIDQKMKIWRPNKDSVSNLQVFGKDTMSWVGKQIKLSTMKIQGKDSIIAMPVQ